MKLSSSQEIKKKKTIKTRSESLRFCFPNSFFRNAVKNGQKLDWRIFLPTLFGIQLEEVGVNELERDLETIGDKAFLVGAIQMYMYPSLSKLYGSYIVNSKYKRRIYFLAEIIYKNDENAYVLMASQENVKQF